jgi:hypothetical protein
LQRAYAYGQVKSLLDQIDCTVAKRQIDAQLRIQTRQIQQYWRHAQLPKAFWHADPQAADGLHAATVQIRLGCIQLLECTGAALVVDLPFRSQGLGTRIALQ